MKQPNEFKTGLLVLGGCAIFIFANIFLKGINIGQDGYTLFIRFANAGGIRVGSDVRHADGKRIGRVVDMRMVQNETVTETILETFISKEAELTTESRANITSASFLSELFVSISPGMGGGEKLKAGDMIEGDSPMSMTDSIQEFGLLMKNLNALISTTGEDSIVRDVSAVIRNVTTNVERMISNSGGDLAATFTTIRGTAVKLDQLVGEFKGSGDKMQTLLNSLNSMSANLARIAEATATGNNSVALLLSDKKLYDDLSIIVENLKILSARLRNDPSILLWRDGR